MSSPFRWAIAGFGKVAAGGHHHGILRNGHQLVGLTTSDPTIRNGDATHVQFNWGTTGLPFDASRMIVSERPDDDWLLALNGKADAVIVCVPTEAHYAVVDRVLKAGFHCLVEKPVAMTSAEGRSLADTARRRRRKLLVAHVLPAFQEFALLRQTILTKGFDRLRSLKLHRWVPWTLVEEKDRIALTTGYYKDLAVHDNHFVASLDAEAFFRMSKPTIAHGKTQRAYVDIGLRKAGHMNVVIDAGANPDVTGFRHGFAADWSDGTSLSYEAGVLRDEKDVISLPSQGPAEIFGEELRFAAELFRLGGDPGYLCVDAACEALDLVDRVP